MKIFSSLAFAAAFLLTTASANAATITTLCPGTAATNDREFTVTVAAPGATCLAYGSGNISGSSDAVNALGYLTLDKSDDAGTGLAPGSLTFTPPTSGLSGTFSIALPTGFHRFVVALKSGEGQLDPDWAAFLLPAGVTSGSWTISGQQELSHASLYGQRCGGTNPSCDDPGDTIPEPTTMALLGLGLLGAGIARRRKQ